MSTTPPGTVNILDQLPTNAFLRAQAIQERVDCDADGHIARVYNPVEDITLCRCRRVDYPGHVAATVEMEPTPVDRPRHAGDRLAEILRANIRLGRPR